MNDLEIKEAIFVNGQVIPVTDALLKLIKERYFKDISRDKSLVDEKILELVYKMDYDFLDQVGASEFMIKSRTFFGEIRYLIRGIGG